MRNPMDGLGLQKYSKKLQVQATCHKLGDMRFSKASLMIKVEQFIVCRVNCQECLRCRDRVKWGQSLTSSHYHSAPHWAGALPGGWHRCAPIRRPRGSTWRDHYRHAIAIKRSNHLFPSITIPTDNGWWLLLGVGLLESTLRLPHNQFWSKQSCQALGSGKMQMAWQHSNGGGGSCVTKMRNRWLDLQSPIWPPDQTEPPPTLSKPCANGLSSIVFSAIRQIDHFKEYCQH